MVKLEELTKERSGIIELQVGDGEDDVLRFYWHSPKGLQWMDAQMRAKNGEDTIGAFRNVMLTCIDYVEDEEGKHKFTAKTLDSLGFVADILLSVFIEQVEPAFRHVKRR